MADDDVQNAGQPTGPSSATLEPVQKDWAGRPAEGVSYAYESTKEDVNYDPQKKPSPWAEIGASGLHQYGGFIREEFLNQLAGDNALRAWREMYDNDAIVGAFMHAITMLMRKVEWRVEPPEAASVEEIVQARMEERLKLKQQAQAAEAQRQMGAMGMAGMMPAGMPGAHPGVAPGHSVPGGHGGMTSPVTAPLHQGLPPHPGMGAMGQPGTTSPDQPGSNPRSAETLPGTNYPATPNTPGSNTGGGPAQAPALEGDFGTGPGGSSSGNPRQKGPFVDEMQKAGDVPGHEFHGNQWSAGKAGITPKQNVWGVDTVHGDRKRWTVTNLTTGHRHADEFPSMGEAIDMASHLQSGGGVSRDKMIDPDWGVTVGDRDRERAFDAEVGTDQNDPLAKATGTSVGGFDASQALPIDPETGLPMEFPVGAGLNDIDPQAQKALELAVFVETCLHDMSHNFADVLSQIVTMVPFGFSYFESVYKKRNGPNPDLPEQGSRFSDGRIGWAKWAFRAQETRFRWEFGPHNEILGMWQLAPPKFNMRYLPRSKCLHFRTSAFKDNPEGKSVLRNAYRSWFLLKRIQEIEAIGIERDLAGLPVAKVPAQMMSDSATVEEKGALEAIKKMMRNIKRNEQEGIVFPCAYDPDSKGELFQIELLSASGNQRAFDVDKVITRYEQRMAMTVLADFILLGHEDVGARALGETKADLFTTALEAWLDVIADEINTAAIPRLLQMNGEDPALAPKLTHGKLESISLEELSQLITAMAGAGAPLFPDQPLEDFLRERGGMPPKASNDDL